MIEIPINLIMAGFLCVLMISGLVCIGLGFVGLGENFGKVLLCAGIILLFVPDVAAAILSANYIKSPNNSPCLEKDYSSWAKFTDQPVCTYNDPASNPYALQIMHPLTWCLGALSYIGKIGNGAVKFT